MRLRLLIASLLAGLGALFTLPFTAIGTVTSPPAAAVLPPSEPPVVRCTDGTPNSLHFYFFDKGKESKGSFGPSADKGSDDATKDELVRRLCGDENTGQDLVLLGVIDRLHKVTVPGAVQEFGEPNFPPDVASDLVYNAIDWDRSTVVTTTGPDSSQTLFMRKGDGNDLLSVAMGTNVPHVLVTRMSDSHRHSRFLKLFFNDSDRFVLLRLPCGFQPVFDDEREAKLVAD